MKYLISNRDLDAKDVKNIAKEYDVMTTSVASFSILMEKKVSVHHTADSSAFVDGYLREFNFGPEEVEKQLTSAVNFISVQWPVNENITGSFSCAVINKVQEEVVMCNDPIGVYPLYYYRNGDNFYISNSIIWLGVISREKIDEVGLFQRTYCPEFATIGSRTIFKDCKRLLPGEWIKFKRSGEKQEVRYDNSLYQNISSKEQKVISPQTYWQKFKKEITYCTGESERIHIALSGGLDSRLILGGVSSEKGISCHTYGKKDYYETMVAERIARLKRAEFTSYSNLSLNFPPKRILYKETAATEAVFLGSWLEILEEQENPNREVLLLGDMTESLQGRNLAVGKNFQSFWKYYVGKKSYPFKLNNKGDFKKWKEKVLITYSGLISEKHINRVDLKLSEETLRKEIERDLQEVFDRIEAHRLPFSLLNQELFSWFTHARNPMGKQILQLNSAFKSYCPSMSIQALRLTSNIHPNQRLNGRFVKALFSSVEELRSLGRVPTSQIPFISYNAPNLFRIPLWFLRSKIDGFLINRLMRSKQKNRRYRLFKSYNWVEVYQTPGLEEILSSYFTRNKVGIDYTEGVIKGALSRRDLENWPLTNVNILNAAALNAELEIIDSLKKGNEI